MKLNPEQNEDTTDELPQIDPDSSSRWVRELMLTLAPQKVLFVCEHNVGRSALALIYLCQLYPYFCYQFASAGISEKYLIKNAQGEPLITIVDQVGKSIVKASILMGWGQSVASQTVKILTAEQLEDADVVVFFNQVQEKLEFEPGNPYASFKNEVPPEALRPFQSDGSRRQRLFNLLSTPDELATGQPPAALINFKGKILYVPIADPENATRPEEVLPTARLIKSLLEEFSLLGLFVKNPHGFLYSQD